MRGRLVGIDLFPKNKKGRTREIGRAAGQRRSLSRLYEFAPSTSSNSPKDTELGDKERARLPRLMATTVMSGMFGFCQGEIAGRGNEIGLNGATSSSGWSGW